jgi:predicted HTH transcriptional regulator
VLYRDYSRRGESIRVFYYADRLDIHSPGLLLPGITVEQMRRGEVTSKLRNLLRDIPGYLERVGSEIRLMLNETRRLGLPPPQFREMSEFVLTFLKALVAAAAAPSPKETLWGSEEGQQNALVEPPRYLCKSRLSSGSVSFCVNRSQVIE